MKIYLDIYFILNLIMNFFLLLMTGILRQKRILPIRLMLCSVCSSLFSTVVYVLSCLYGIGFLFLDLCSIPVLVCLSYQDRNVRICFRDSLFLGIMTMLTGGCLYAMYSALRICLPDLFLRQNSSAVLSLCFIMVGLLLLSVVFLLLGKEFLQQVQYGKSTCEAVLFHAGKEYHIQILRDTGNQLISPYTGERVAVISKALASEMGIEQEQPMLYIPYHSIGGSGILPAYRLERLEWTSSSNCHSYRCCNHWCCGDNWGNCSSNSHGSNMEQMEHFLAAVSGELEEKEIQMIVNNS